MNNNEDIENYQNFVAVIVKQSCKDYVQALKMNLQGEKWITIDSCKESVDKLIKENEIFFRSEIFLNITEGKLDGEIVIAKLQEQARKEYEKDLSKMCQIATK